MSASVGVNVYVICSDVCVCVCTLSSKIISLGHEAIAVLPLYNINRSVMDNSITRASGLWFWVHNQQDESLLLYMYMNIILHSAVLLAMVCGGNDSYGVSSSWPSVLLAMVWW